MKATARVSPPETDDDLRTELLRSRPVNPVVVRLKARVLAGVDASQVITSYDRMYHRHNRS